MSAAAWVLAGLGGVLTLLVASIMITRSRGNRRRRRAAALRPRIEVALGDYLSDLDGEKPDPPASEAGRALFREVAVEALIQLRGTEREHLARLLEDTGIVATTAAGLDARQRGTRIDAADYLAEIRSPSAVTALSKSLADRDRDVRLAAARALAELADPAFLEAAIDVAEEGAVERPGAAAAVLLAIGNRAPEYLGKAMTSSRSPPLRRLALAVTSELRLARFGPRLRVTLGNADDELVARAARGLGAIGDARAVERLISILDGSSRPTFCRIAAAGALGAIADPAAAGALERALASGDWTLRSRAAASLGLLGAPGQEALRRALNSPDADIQAQARLVLGS